MRIWLEAGEVTRPATTSARERIIDAAMRCIDLYGPHKTGLSDVATELGVTRETVYRLFESTDDLLLAVGAAAVDDYLDRLAAHVADLSEPGDAIREATPTRSNACLRSGSWGCCSRRADPRRSSKA